MANHIALRRIEADADSEPHQPDTIHATNTMQAARVIKTIFFILVPIQVSLPSHSASEQVTKSKGRPGGDLAQQSFELSEHLLDRIEVGRIGKQIVDVGEQNGSSVFIWSIRTQLERCSPCFLPVESCSRWRSLRPLMRPNSAL
jgi:hypothetical protein